MGFTVTDRDDRIAALEAELEHVKSVAVGMMSGLCFGIAHTPIGLRELADGMVEPGKDPDPAISELARRLEAQLRDAAEKIASRSST